ncbi:MAG: XRE family transcriptional regulator, partial [Chloroflexi bacterium]|nr:XRE family transcriptional regulator [Chloroflexota bacterium]
MPQGGPVAGGVSLGATGRRSGDQDRRAVPMPLRPRGGFGAYLNDLRGLRGMTIRGLAAAAGLHHTYISKLERGDRQAPDPKVVEALATALRVSPSQLDQLRWRAGLG